MKIFSISDLHLSLCGEKPMEVFDGWDNYLDCIKQSWLSNVSDDDVVVIAGDISWAMRLDEFQVDMQYFESLPGKKVFVRGNHDYWWSSVTKVRAILPKNCYVLQNDCVKLQNVCFCGTRGWTVPERNQTMSEEDEKILNRELIRADISLNEMARVRKPGDKVVFVMHYPPFDSTRTFDKFTQLFELYKVDVVIYGHLHGKHIRSKLYELRNGVSYYLTSTDQVNHQLVPIEIK